MSQPRPSQDCPRSWLGEHHDEHAQRTRWVVVLTLVMMVAEIFGGTWYGSMALVADGWHMATHAAALGAAAMAYRYASRHADNPRFAFGTGKVGDLTGFASAISLGIVALLIGWESAQRLIAPVGIDFTQASGIAVVGLLVNLVSAWLLRHDHDHAHGDAHDHDHGHDDAHDHDHDHDDHDHQTASPVHQDTNLRAAYVHVLADAVTSVLAIIGLLAGKFLGWIWMDAAVGLLGAALIAHWSIGLARSAARTLLDSHDDGALETKIRQRVKELAGDPSISDLHLWRLGPGHYGLMFSVQGGSLATPDQYRAGLAQFPQLGHITIEINPA